MTATNAAIFLITDTNRVLMVQENPSKKNPNGKWMTPGGRVNTGELPWTAAKREFTEETGFVLDRNLITSKQRYDMMHTYKTSTAIFIIRTKQRFPKYDKRYVLNNETSSLHYFQLNHFKKLMDTNCQIFKQHVINSSIKLMNLNYI